MRLDRLIAELLPDLNAAGVPGAARDLRILAAHVLGVSRDRLGLYMGEDVTPEQEARLRACARARGDGRPVSRVIGTRLFWNRDFQITDAVLDPRPETETLIAAALECPAKRVLDLGTGSGAIAVTLAAEWPDATLTASDISLEALAVAETNAQRLGVATRMTFLQSDWYDNITGRFDLIVSNPPYIAAAEMADLAREVADFDPRVALTDEADGLQAYRAIVRKAGEYLTQSGRLMLEIGWQQGAAVARLVDAAGLVETRILRDFDGRERVVCAKRA